MATSCCQHQPQPSSAGWELLNTPHTPRSLWVAPSCPFWTPQLLQGPEHEGPDGDCSTTRPGSLRSAEAPRMWLLLLPEANTACGERVLPQAWTHCAWWPEEPWLGQPGQDGGELSWATLPAPGTNRADLLPLPVQLGLVVRLLEAAGFASLRHLDPVLEGRPGDGVRVRCSWGIHQAQDLGSSPETPPLLALSSRTQVWPAQPPAQDPGSAPHSLGQRLFVVHVLAVLLLRVEVPAAQRPLLVTLQQQNPEQLLCGAGQFLRRPACPGQTSVSQQPPFTGLVHPASGMPSPRSPEQEILQRRGPRQSGTAPQHLWGVRWDHRSRPDPGTRLSKAQSAFGPASGVLAQVWFAVVPDPSCCSPPPHRYPLPYHPSCEGKERGRGSQRILGTSGSTSRGAQILEQKFLPLQHHKGIQDCSQDARSASALWPDASSVTTPSSLGLSLLLVGSRPGLDHRDQPSPGQARRTKDSGPYSQRSQGRKQQGPTFRFLLPETSSPAAHPAPKPLLPYVAG